MNLPQGADGCAYKDMPAWPGYALSDAGWLWSCKDCRGRLTDQWHLIRPRIDPDSGYLRVSMVDRGRRRTACLNVLVLEVFTGPAPYRHEACHRDGNRKNNTVENLYWGTRKQNAADSIRHGTMARGSKHGQSRLEERDIPVIRALGESRVPQRVIAAAFNVSLRVVTAILNGETWTHVLEDSDRG